jgi:serine/threonine-protein kinase
MIKGWLFMENLIGKIFHNYEILAFVGKGGHGAVYHAKKPDEQDVALKVLLPEHAEDDDLIKRIRIEAEIIHDLNHPHIVTLIDTWDDDNGIWLVMPWIGGGDLRTYIETNGAMPPQQFNPILEQICSALEAAHEKQIVHRDLKPDNILLDEAGNAYLTDFGIAKRMGYSTITSMGVVMGSPEYLSPEQIMGYEISPRTDIYALGITIYELLAGHHPFVGEKNKVKLMMKMVQQDLPSLDNDNIHPELSHHLDTLIQRATDKKAENRYENASALAAHFREIIS